MMLDALKNAVARMEPYERDMMRRLLNGDADSDLIRREDIHRALSEQKVATLHMGLTAREREVAQRVVTECMRAVSRAPFQRPDR